MDLWFEPWILEIESFGWLNIDFFTILDIVFNHGEDINWKLIFGFQLEVKKLNFIICSSIP